MGYGRIRITGDLLREVLHFPPDTEMPAHIELIVMHADIPGDGVGALVECEPQFTRHPDGAVSFAGWHPLRRS